MPPLRTRRLPRRLGIPAFGRFSSQLFDNIERFAHVRALGRFVDILVVNPAKTVACNFVTKATEFVDQFGMTLQRHCDGKYGKRKFTGFELA